MFPVLKSSMRTMSSLTFPKPNLDEIRSQFRKLEGGQVTLTKNEENGIAYIAIDHPEKKNGMSGKMLVDLNEAVSSLENWKTGKGVILYGKGDMFCSGGYLDTIRKICNHQDGFRMVSLIHDSVIRLRKLPLISLSIIHGKAFGGGAELILATDFRLMCPAAEICFQEARMGVGTLCGGGYFLPKLVGRGKALDLLLTCRKIKSEEARAIGLVDGELIPGDSLDEEKRIQFGQRWLEERVKSHNASVVQTIKNIVHSEDLELEKEFFAESWGGAAQLEAISSLSIKHK